MKRILSKDNPIVRFTRSLKRKKGRDRYNCYIIEGPKLLAEALDNRAEILHAFFCEETDYENTVHLMSALEEVGVTVLMVEKKLFSDLADTETPQSVMAVVRKQERSPAEGDWLILDRIQDPGNIGTLIRTADAAGFKSVILIKGSGDVYAPKVVRASAGSFFRITIGTVEDAAEAVSLAELHGKKIIAADPGGGMSCYDVDLGRPEIALVIGNEGNGLDERFVNSADHLVRIPMPGRVESLNASIAAAILMFETVRQRDFFLSG